MQIQNKRTDFQFFFNARYPEISMREFLRRIFREMLLKSNAMKKGSRFMVPFETVSLILQIHLYLVTLP